MHQQFHLTWPHWRDFLLCTGIQTVKEIKVGWIQVLFYPQQGTIGLYVCDRGSPCESSQLLLPFMFCSCVDSPRLRGVCEKGKALGFSHSVIGEAYCNPRGTLEIQAIVKVWVICDVSKTLFSDTNGAQRAESLLPPTVTDSHTFYIPLLSEPLSSPARCQIHICQTLIH